MRVFIRLPVFPFLLGGILFLLAPESQAIPPNADLPGNQSIGTSQSLDLLPEHHTEKLSVFHQDGLTSDRSHISDMVQTLHSDVYPDMRKTVLLALARLGATQALQEMDTIPKSDPDLANFEQAARIRLLAQTEKTPELQIQRFFQELGETPEQLNTKVADYSQKCLTSVYAVPIPMEVDALKQLADMIYHGSYADFIAQPQVAQLKWTDGLAKEKIIMGALSSDEQRKTMIEKIAHSSIGFSYEWQLLVDLGHKETAAAVIAKLQEMDGDRSHYSSENFRYLFTVLYATGDHYESPIWEHFKHDSDPNVAAAVTDHYVQVDVITPGY